MFSPTAGLMTATMKDGMKGGFDMTPTERRQALVRLYGSDKYGTALTDEEIEGKLEGKRKIEEYFERVHVFDTSKGYPKIGGKR